jgi:hypothetical protein
VSLFGVLLTDHMFIPGVSSQHSDEMKHYLLTAATSQLLLF